MKTFSQIRIVFTTAVSPENADEIARVIINEGLAACVTIIPSVTSYYKWKGEFHITPEFMLKIKTYDNKLEEVEKFIKKLSQYELPEILSLKEVDASDEYNHWMYSLLGGQNY